MSKVYTVGHYSRTGRITDWKHDLPHRYSDREFRIGMEEIMEAPVDETNAVVEEKEMVYVTNDDIAQAVNEEGERRKKKKCNKCVGTGSYRDVANRFRVCDCEEGQRIGPLCEECGNSGWMKCQYSGKNTFVCDCVFGADIKKQLQAEQLTKVFFESPKSEVSGEELIKRLEALFASMLATAKRKNADYAGQGENRDGFANLRMIELLTHGKITTEMGFIVRMSDKFSRIISLVLSGKDPQVIEESLADTLVDLSNYSALMAIYRGAGQ